MPARWVCLAIVLPLGGLSAIGLASSENDQKELAPRLISFDKEPLLLSEALAQVQRQAGNPVADRRLAKNDPKITLDLAAAGYWQALDAIAKKADARLSFYQQDGVIALVDGPHRSGPVCYHGLFRMAVKRLAVAQEEEAGRHTCLANLEVAWEPRFQPFYLEVAASAVLFSKDARGNALKVDVPSRGQLAVAGRSAVEVEVRAPAPHRSAAKIEFLKGIFNVIGPSKMLSFTFANLKPNKGSAGAVRKKEEGVTVSLNRVAVEPERWTFDVTIDNPPGGPKFESYQSWLDNNEIFLEKGRGQDRQVFLPNSADEEQLENLTAQHAAIRYHFTRRDRRQPLPGKLEDWRLVYRTPGRIVEMAVPFAFKDLPLP